MEGNVKKTVNKTNKFLMILLALIILSIPIGFLYGIVKGRESYRALMTAGLIGAYTKFAITKSDDKNFAIIISGMLVLLYTFLYILLMLQDLSLLIGSFVLFTIIAIIMYSTRNVEWYDK